MGRVMHLDWEKMITEQFQIRTAHSRTGILHIGRRYARTETRQPAEPSMENAFDKWRQLYHLERYKEQISAKVLPLWGEVDVFAKAHRYCYPRRLFVTKGKRMGVTSIYVKADDLVFLIYGTNVPFVLRKSKDKNEYTLVGETYCHGFMDGEEIRDADGKDVDIATV